MASSLIGGLIAKGYAPGKIRVADKDPAQLEGLERRFSVLTCPDNESAAAPADAVVIAVKPQHMAEAVKAVSAAVRGRESQVISVAAGVREPDIRRWLGFDAAIVRCMPNTPALLGAGATALFANAFVTHAQRKAAAEVMDAVGLTVWVDEEASLDAVTALSGSGPAYYFLLMELMEESGVALGLERETARRLTLQTALGAAEMANESAETPAQLRTRVTSPGGTTERALETLTAGGLATLVDDALRAAAERAAELGNTFGDA